MRARSRHNPPCRFSRSVKPIQAPIRYTAIIYVSRDEYEIQFADIFDQITAYAAGGPINAVNPEVLDSASKRP